ncbi:MAG TPA: anti-sigma factor [Gemmatimonadaceae bacterium]|jgi:anti-sigma factor (TIGR02949 family)
MQCADCRTRLDAYLDKELSADERAEVREHLAGCSDCTRELTALERASTLAQEHLVRYEAPDVLKARITNAIASERSVPAETPSAPPRRAGWWRFAAAGVIIALASGGLTYAVARGGAGSPALADQVLASHIRSLMPGHLTDVQSTNEHNVKPWFNGRVDFSPKVPVLDSAGFPLVGGRLDYLDGRVVAAVVYARRQHLINVDSWPEAGANEGPTSTEAHGYHLIRWRADNVEYWAVSDLESGELSTFVSLYSR